jgi:hypothetical protein
MENIPKMAEAHSIAVAGGGPAGRLRLGPFDLADGSDLTQIFGRPLRGQEFFEEIIRDNLDLGRPDRVQLVFDRIVTKKLPAS